MHILGIETSTKTGSIAIVSDEGVVAEYSLNIEVTHSERLMSTLDRVLSDSGMTIAALDGFAVAIGPGSFTGLRIGISAVKGLALATGKPVAAVPTLLALARRLPYAGAAVCPMLDARKNEVYAALYRHGAAGLVQTLPESVLSIATMMELVKEKTIFTGEAAYLYRLKLEEGLGDRALFAPYAAGLPSGAVVGEMGIEIFKRGGQADADSLAPLYIRRPEAEVAWEKRQTSR